MALFYVQNGRTVEDRKTEPKPRRIHQVFPVKRRIFAYVAIMFILVAIAIVGGLTCAAFAASAISGSHDGIDRLADFLTRK